MGALPFFFFKEEEIWERERCLYRGGWDWPDSVPAVNLSKNHQEIKNRVLLSSGCAETCAGSREEPCPSSLGPADTADVQGQVSGGQGERGYYHQLAFPQSADCFSCGVGPTLGTA